MSRDDADQSRIRLTEAMLLTGQGDRQAFSALYHLTAAKLFGICLRVCGDRQAAEDVLHDVYITIWHRAGAYEPSRGSPITWLAAIARNRAIDWRRANGRQLVPIEAAEAVPDPGQSAHDRLDQDDEARLLLECLETLDDNQRESIRTAYFMGLTYSEVAARAGVPLGP